MEKLEIVKTPTLLEALQDKQNPIWFNFFGRTAFHLELQGVTTGKTYYLAHDEASDFFFMDEDYQQINSDLWVNDTRVRVKTPEGETVEVPVGSIFTDVILDFLILTIEAARETGAWEDNEFLKLLFNTSSVHPTMTVDRYLDLLREAKENLSGSFEEQIRVPLVATLSKSQVLARTPYFMVNIEKSLQVDYEGNNYYRHTKDGYVSWYLGHPVFQNFSPKNKDSLREILMGITETSIWNLPDFDLIETLIKKSRNQFDFVTSFRVLIPALISNNIMEDGVEDFIKTSLTKGLTLQQIVNLLSAGVYRLDTETSMDAQLDFSAYLNTPV